MAYAIEKSVLKAIENEEYYEVADFIADVKRYIKACKEERILCTIPSVSSSGMSRTMKFVEHAYDRKTKRGYVLNFFMLFKLLGYQRDKGTDAYRIHGCGMDMVFNTNYNNIYRFESMGFIRSRTARKLSQNTPHVL